MEATAERMCPGCDQPRAAGQWRPLPRGGTYPRCRPCEARAQENRRCPKLARDREAIAVAADRLVAAGEAVTYPRLSEITKLRHARLWRVAHVMKRDGDWRWDLAKRSHPAEVASRPLSPAAAVMASDPRWMGISREMSSAAARRWPWLDLDAFESAAMFAIIRAARNYEPARGPFDRYLRKTIRWATFEVARTADRAVQLVERDDAA